MQKKLIKSAGPLVAEALYKPRTSPAGRGRGRKTNPTNEMQRIVNDKLSWLKLKWLLAANFIKGDIVGCLTFDDDHLPETRKQVTNKLGWFRRKAEAARRERGQELVMFWSIEHRHGDGRWHIHIVANATGGEDYAELHRLWGQGETEFAALRVDTKRNYETLARYMCKEAREFQPTRPVRGATANLHRSYVQICARITKNDLYQPTSIQNIPFMPPN